MSNLIVQSKTPNVEQQLAIYHDGGKILSAGAGSGKTFVIIEHIIERLKKHSHENPRDQWNNTVPFYLPKIVLMTFTKKAAGEMSIRMMKKVDELCQIAEAQEKPNEKEFWEIVRKNLSRLNVTTISAFCSQLLKQGLIPDVETNIEILSDIEFKNKITKIYNEWFIKNEHRLDQVFKANPKTIVEGMIEIFSSPELRLMWNDSLGKIGALKELDIYFKSYFELYDYSVLFDGPLDYKYEGKPKAWVSYLEGLDQLIQKYGRVSAANYEEYHRYFDSISTTPRKTNDLPNLEQFEAAKNLAKHLKEIHDDFSAFTENYDVYWDWVNVLNDAYKFIVSAYFTEKGLTYSDLEYLVCLGLRKEEVRIKIKSNFSYFIVDEFQDTSSVQFEIVKHLVEEEHQRLFCVGDIKQAIYGFRGGELLVFEQCIEMLGASNNLKLKNNFRSLGKVIAFNNAFFTDIFPVGVGFEGLDAHTVAMESQATPNEKEESGKVLRLEVEVRGAQKATQIDCDQVEAEILFSQIQKLLSDDEIENICVLYRKLAPSAYLIEQLVKNKINFNAQVKISYDEDPIINLFMRFIESKLNLGDDKKLNSTKFLLQCLFDVLEIQKNVEETLKKFLDDLPVLGLRLAFHKTIYSLGLTNSLYANNSQFIDSICRVCQDELVKVYELLSTEGDARYSLDMINGGEGKKVTIMTAHASKGLEFDAVLLGGIYSNGRSMGKREIIGKMPRSLRWKKAYNQKKFFKSPMYFFEADFEKNKDFSESKRLLYVACTRAVKFLSWVDLKATLEDKVVSLGEGGTSGHWIKAFRLYQDTAGLIESESATVEHREKEKDNISLILKDTLGIGLVDEAQHLGVFAETSVTKLTQLALCPFKFYLNNICKINPPQFIPELDAEALGDEEEVFYSSKKRGIQIHATLAAILENKMEIEDAIFEDRDKLQWALDEIQQERLPAGQLIVEKLVKFSFFGQMISGTPDLVSVSSDDLVIWDFKTGLRDESGEVGYWFQLMCYAMAYSKLNQITPEKKITLILLYLDEKKSVSKIVDYSELSTFLFEKWKKTESLYQINNAHCAVCEYSTMCTHPSRNAQ